MKRWVWAGLLAGAMAMGGAASAQTADWSGLGIANSTPWHLVGPEEHGFYLFFVHKEPNVDNVIWELLAFRQARKYAIGRDKGEYWYELRKVSLNCRGKKRMTLSYSGYDLADQTMFYYDVRDAMFITKKGGGDVVEQGFDYACSGAGPDRTDLPENTEFPDVASMQAYSRDYFSKP